MAYSVTVTAYVDGISDLHLKGNQIWWDNIAYAVPGRWGYPGAGNDKPTVVQVSNDFGGATQSYDWYPWSSTTSTGKLISSPYSLGALPSNFVITTATITSKVGRGSINLTTAPTSNNREAVIRFDDASPLAADFYTVNLVLGDPSKFSLSSSASIIDEGATAVFNLATSNVPAGTVLSYSVSGNVSALDISSGSLSGTTTVGSDGKSVIYIPIVADKTTEGSETMTVTVQNASVSTTIQDTSIFEAPTYRLSSNAASVNEGSTATFLLNTTNVQGGTTLIYTLSGVSGSDIVGGATSGTVVVGTNANGTSTISVPIAADRLTEGAETLSVTIQGTSATAAVAINDTSKSPTYLLSGLATSVDEGSSASFRLLTLDLPAGSVVNYTLSGVSSADIVGSALTGSVSVGSDGTATIQVPIAADRLTEGAETLSLGIPGTSAAASVVINDTSPTLVTYQLSSLATSVDEGNSASFRLQTTGVAAGTVVNYTLSGVSSADIVGGALTGSVSVGSDGNATIVVPIAADKLTEITETLTVSAQGLSASTRINDTSPTPPPTYRLSTDTNSTDEGAAASFTLTTTNVPAGTVIPYSLSGISSSDITGGALSGFTTVGPDGTALITVSLAADNVTEGVETVVVSAQNTSASMLINDTSLNPPSVYRLTRNVASVDEGGTASFVLTTTNVPAGTVLNYDLSGVLPSDIAGGALSGTVTVNSRGTATIAVPIAADKTTDGSDTMTITVESTSADVIINDTSKGVAIYDVISTSPSVEEGSNATFTLNTTNVPVDTLVNYTITGLSSADMTDGMVNGTVMMDANGAATITVPVAADNLTEGNENLTVTVNGKSASTLVLDTSKELAPIYVIRQSAASVDEGNVATFTVEGTNVKAGHSVAYRVSGLNAEDITGGQVNGRAVFDDLGMATLSVPIAQDGKTEGSESLTLTIGSATSTITVNDTSKSDSQYFISASDGIVEEGKIATFTVSAADAVPGTKLAYTISGPGINGRDITNGKLSGSVSIGVDSSAIITVPIAADKTTEGDEDLMVTLTGQGVSETITIDDTSTAVVAVPTYTLSNDEGAVKEGDTAEFLVETTGVAAGTTLSYKITGVQTSDVVGKKLSGTVKVGEDGTATISVPIATDTLSEGNEKLTVTVNGKSASVAVLDDTSIRVAETVAEGSDMALYKTSMGSFVLADAGLSSGDGLDTYVPLMASVTRAFVPKNVSAVLSYDDGSYGLLSGSGTGAKASYSEQKFNSDGIAQGKAVKLTAAQVLTKETVAQVDLNGDGEIGDVIRLVFDGDGDANQQDYGLYRTSSGAVVLGAADQSEGDAAGSGVTLMANKTKGWVVPNGTSVAGIAITEGGSLEVLTLRGKQYSAQKFDAATGLIKGKAVVLKTAQVDAREYHYDLDLTGDGEISTVGVETMPSGWAV